METILEIIEDYTDTQLPEIFYYALILIYFFQVSIPLIHYQNQGYIYSNFEIKPLYDSKAKILGNIGELSAITFLLFYKGNDTLTLLFFAVVFSINLFYYSYVAFIIYLKVPFG